MSTNQPNQTITVATGNEITARGKGVAGFLLVVFTILPIVLIIGIWPNKLPPIGNDTDMVYRFSWFNVTLDVDHGHTTGKGQTNPLGVHKTDVKDKDVKVIVKKKEPVKKGVDDKAADKKAAAAKAVSGGNEQEYSVINLNAIIFLLVASAGFLGSMIHIASSFTAFIGSNQFLKSWLLWYIVKPFTGASLALVLYFVLRAGLLNVGDSNIINLFGVVTLAALAGLFSDKASMKLEEVFTVLFRPADNRSGKLEKDKVNVTIKVTDINPEEITTDALNNMTINGEGFDNQKVVLKINNVEVTDLVRESRTIKFSYQVPDELKTGQSITLQLFDESGKEILKKDILFKKKEDLLEESADPQQTTDDDDTTNDEDEDSIKG
jgi:hypothetical protein